MDDRLLDRLKPSLKNLCDGSDDSSDECNRQERLRSSVISRLATTATKQKQLDSDTESNNSDSKTNMPSSIELLAVDCSFFNVHSRTEVRGLINGSKVISLPIMNTIDSTTWSPPPISHGNHQQINLNVLKSYWSLTVLDSLRQANAIADAGRPTDAVMYIINVRTDLVTHFVQLFNIPLEKALRMIPQCPTLDDIRFFKSKSYSRNGNMRGSDDMEGTIWGRLRRLSKFGTTSRETQSPKQSNHDEDKAKIRRVRLLPGTSGHVSSNASAMIEHTEHKNRSSLPLFRSNRNTVKVKNTRPLMNGVEVLGRGEELTEWLEGRDHEGVVGERVVGGNSYNSDHSHNVGAMLSTCGIDKDLWAFVLEEIASLDSMVLELLP
ncbi:hypothetical protein HDU76_000821 [Blyttiomyces sp. JEL0837]|nr:hypothetical protein HDU76_000821 [Blyttiomyces sp. JEL0837]